VVEEVVEDTRVQEAVAAGAGQAMREEEGCLYLMMAVELVKRVEDRGGSGGGDSAACGGAKDERGDMRQTPVGIPDKTQLAPKVTVIF
jgi:hypothetical protein